MTQQEHLRMRFKLFWCSAKILSGHVKMYHENLALEDLTENLKLSAESQDLAFISKIYTVNLFITKNYSSIALIFENIGSS